MMVMGQMENVRMYKILNAWWIVESKNWTNLGFWNVIEEISIQFLNKRNERDKNSDWEMTH